LKSLDLFFKKDKIMKKIITILVLSGFLILPISILAAPADDCVIYCEDPSASDPPAGQTCICNPLEYQTLEELIEHLTNFILAISLALVPAAILFGAFYILTAAVDPNRVQKGQKVIMYAVIGLGIILFAKGIISLIRYVLGGS